MANIAEGLSCKSDKEFARFLITAKRSALEAQSHFYVALDRNYFVIKNSRPPICRRKGVQSNYLDRLPLPRFCDVYPARSSFDHSMFSHKGMLQP